MEEFQESDVLWPDAHQHQHHHPDCYRRHSHADHHQQQQLRSTARAAHQQRQSAPVRIPAAPPAEAVSTSRRHSWARGYDDDAVDEGDDDDGVIVRRASSGAEAAAIVPPHVLAARRCAAERKVASSVCVGHGRTLKGRDLRAVRNAVLHMTGFLSSSDE